MDDKGEIVSSCDVDENIALQIWTKGLSPRLVVFNKNKNSRKLIRLSWMEKRDRKLAVKGKGRTESFSYAIADLVPILQRILSEYAVYAAFRPRLWKFAVQLEKVLHVPEIITDRGELNLLSEERRSALWIADFTEGDRRTGDFSPLLSPWPGGTSCPDGGFDDPEQRAHGGRPAEDRGRPSAGQGEPGTLAQSGAYGGSGNVAGVFLL